MLAYNMFHLTKMLEDINITINNKVFRSRNHPPTKLKNTKTGQKEDSTLKTKQFSH